MAGSYLLLYPHPEIAFNSKAANHFLRYYLHAYAEVVIICSSFLKSMGKPFVFYVLPE
jgi:hypothetical protein